MISQDGWPRKTSVETMYERCSKQTGHRTVTEPGSRIDRQRNAPLASLAAHNLDSITFRGWHCLGPSLMFPDLRQGADEYFGRSVNLPCAADIAGHASWKSGNSASKAECLRSAGLTPDQRLACSDQDWHSGRVARQDAERQRKG
jgi:hypothetical protein